MHILVFRHHCFYMRKTCSFLSKNEKDCSYFTVQFPSQGKPSSLVRHTYTVYIALLRGYLPVRETMVSFPHRFPFFGLPLSHKQSVVLLVKIESNKVFILVTRKCFPCCRIGTCWQGYPPVPQETIDQPRKLLIGHTSQ